MEVALEPLTLISMGAKVCLPGVPALYMASERVAKSLALPMNLESVVGRANDSEIDRNDSELKNLHSLH